MNQMYGMAGAFLGVGLVAGLVFRRVLHHAGRCRHALAGVNVLRLSLTSLASDLLPSLSYSAAGCHTTRAGALALGGVLPCLRHHGGPWPPLRGEGSAMRFVVSSTRRVSRDAEVYEVYLSSPESAGFARRRLTQNCSSMAP